MDEKMPEYLHLPLQVLWFDTPELTLIAMLYIMAAIFGGIAWAFLFVGPILIIPYKRAQPRGYFSHLLYVLGWQSYSGYPSHTLSRFAE